MPQRRPPQYPLPQGMCWRHFTTGMGAGLPLAEWAYQTPTHPEGLRISDLKNASRAEQIETVQVWFLANYQPFDWVPRGLATSAALIGQMSPGMTFEAPSWSASAIIDDEFSESVPEHIRALVATHFRAKAFTWRLIPDSITSTKPDLLSATVADLEAITAELRSRLERLERLGQVGDEARHGIGGNQGPPMVDLSRPIADAKQALANNQAEKATSALDVFKAVLPDLGKGAMQEVGKYLAQGAIAGAVLAAPWIFHEVCQIIPLLERWLALVAPVV